METTIIAAVVLVVVLVLVLAFAGKRGTTERTTERMASTYVRANPHDKEWATLLVREMDMIVRSRGTYMMFQRSGSWEDITPLKFAQLYHASEQGYLTPMYVSEILLN